MIVGVDEGPRFPWMGLLTRPRETLAIILDEDPTRHVFALMFGVPVALAMAAMVRASGANGSQAFALMPLAACLGGAAALALGILTVTLLWLGRMLGGSGSLARVAAAVAWALFPLLAIAPFLLSDNRDVSRGAWMSGGAVSFGFTVAGLANAHRISLARATLVTALACRFLAGIAYMIQQGSNGALSIVGAAVTLLVGVLIPAALVIACWRGWRMAG